MTDAALDALRDTVRAATAAHAPLAIRGGNTKHFYGAAVVGDVLDTRALTGIVDYEPTELVITARAGTLLADIEAAMRENGQMLAFEPPHFDAGGTLGGAIASGLSGPRRPYAGAARDLVLGVRVLDGAGCEQRFGGQVMKNVAGFDVARLMTGALGTLGVLTEISLKCLPRPRTEATRVVDCDEATSIALVNQWGGKPLPLSATCWHAGRLHVRLSGAAPAVAAAAPIIGGTALDEGVAFWASIRDQSHAFFRGHGNAGRVLWRMSVKSTAPPADFGDTLIEWGGGLRWIVQDAQGDDAPLRAWAAAQGGHATRFRGGEGAAFATPDAVMLGLHQRLKATFDPQGIFNRGRLYPGL